MISRWLQLGAFLVFVMVMIGGITRLTGSGLSITDWNLIMGAVPPLNEADWIAAFEQYKQFPEFQQVNYRMNLSEFKQIFFWEYLHRLIGRILGIIFIIPFIIFWLRGYFNQQLKKRMLFLLILGAAQGAMGWFMVKSGLVDIPAVSHYRLAAHFLLALTLIGFCIWYALDLKPAENTRMADKTTKRLAFLIGILFFIQVFWGTFTAGLHAGLIYNTFPLMNGSWIPYEMWGLKPAILNLFENLGTVQFIHRVNAVFLLISVVVYWWKNRDIGIFASRTKVHLLLFVIVIQFLFGIFTLLQFVPVWMGVTHQAIAILFFIVWLMEYHEVKQAPVLSSGYN